MLKKENMIGVDLQQKSRTVFLWRMLL